MRPFIQKLCLLILLLLMTLSTFANEGVFSVCEKEIIKIGYCENYGTILDEMPSDHRGYGYEYFTKLAENSNIQLRFIKCKWEDAFSMLETGEIDVFGPMQKTEERAQRFGFPDEHFGYEQGYLLASKDSPLYYNDFAKFDQMKVGVVEGAYFIDTLNDFGEENNFAVQYVYTKESQAFNDLKVGKYDAFLSGELIHLPETKVIARLSIEPFYYVTRKDDFKTLQWINAGMHNIFQNDMYYTTFLHEKYYGRQKGRQLAFTKEEVQFAKDYPKLLVGVSKDNQPLQYFDAQDQQYKGISIDFIKEIADNCSIEVEFIDTADKGERRIDIYADRVPLFAKVKSEQSPAYHTASMVLVSTRQQNSWEARTVAIPKIYSTISYQLINRYPNLTIQLYETPQAAIDTVKTNRADFTLLTSNMFEVLTRLYPSETFLIHQTEIKLPLNLAFGSHLPDDVVGLFNKSISSFTQTKADSIVFANTALMTQNFSLLDFTRLYAYQIVTAAIVIFSILLLLIMVIIHMQRTLQHSAYTDDITGAYTFLRFKQEAAEILKTASPYQYALISIDIDNFKYINSIFGYEIGNEVLRAVYQSSQEYLNRDTIVARINADKFVFLVNTHKYSAPTLVYSSEKALSARIQELLGEFYNLALSVGVYTVENPAEDLSIMLDWANIANKNSKKKYGSRLVLFTGEMMNDLQNRRDITVDKERAMENDEFVAFFQPKFHLQTLEICGAELLVRWKKSDQLIPPVNLPPFLNKTVSSKS